MDWNSILGEIKNALVVAAKEANARQTRERPSVRRSQPNHCLFWAYNATIRPNQTLCNSRFEELRDSLIDECPGCKKAKYREYEICLDCYNPNECLFWDCDESIRLDHIFCFDHFQDFQSGLIDECPSCGSVQSRQYEVCLDCYNNSRPQTRKANTASGHGYRWFKPEYSRAWEKEDAKADRFFVYILKLDGGVFYPGQTRELRERLSEHRGGRTKSTQPVSIPSWFGSQQQILGKRQLGCNSNSRSSLTPTPGKYGKW
jgi:hypothetical protein